MKIALIQLDIAFGDVDANIARAEQFIQEAMKQKPDVLVLPELWTTGYDLTRLNILADEEGNDTKNLLSKWATTYNVHIVGGSIAKKNQDGVTNTLYTFAKDGTCAGEYSKAHLFQLMNEHLYLQAGDKQGLFQLDNVPCASVICYDIRFPEWIRTHTVNGATVLFVVAEWPLPRLAHWRTLLISRAIENQCYVVACNRAGSDPNNTFAGHSLIIDPWGEVVVEGDEQEGVLYGTLDFSKIDDVRKGIPVFSDRRSELYF
ncbi:carbon-nitrogen family hydrolase [Priestia taiwanensis]|uniref:Hydrolase n=1 Tax=Priestia taiwanensis TaxID=1347902 RepID=A0A917ER19_9BACI|nr:carbon-nitrogen family hydrolase [Priestia taiwanensis]MBM7363243.1 putative amidohydrolase [Priestia taiwanensis]GGE68856.1 hydrolase [Priestia taiwanensis]